MKKFISSYSGYSLQSAESQVANYNEVFPSANAVFAQVLVGREEICRVEHVVFSFLQPTQKRSKVEDVLMRNLKKTYSLEHFCFSVPHLAVTVISLVRSSSRRLATFKFLSEVSAHELCNGKWWPVDATPAVSCNCHYRT